MCLDLKKIENLKNEVRGYWGERVISELLYAMKISSVNGGKYDRIINDAAEYLYNELKDKGACLV